MLQKFTPFVAVTMGVAHAGTLGQINQFKVTVGGVDQYAERAGFSTAGIISLAEERLRGCGAPIFQPDAGVSAPGVPAILNVYFFMYGPSDQSDAGMARLHGSVLVTVDQTGTLWSGERTRVSTWKAVWNLTAHQLDPEADWNSTLAKPVDLLCSEYTRERATWLKAWEEAKRNAPTSSPAAVGAPIRPTVPSAKECGNTTKLHIGLGKDRVRSLLGDPVISTMAQCGGAPGVKRWACETVTYRCLLGQEYRFVDVVYGLDKAQSWSFEP